VNPAAGSKAISPVRHGVPLRAAQFATNYDRMKKGDVLILGLAGLAIAIAAVVAVVSLQPMFSSGDGGRSGEVTTSGTALVGGPFTLTDHTGRRVTEKDFLGKYTLIYFGYTYCPDVCPGELQLMAAALDEMGDKGDQIQPVFITVDPERDTVEHMAVYVPQFHDRLIGLTGSPEEVAAAAKAYRVYYAKVDDPDATEYLMDHSSILYLMGPDGGYVGHFTYGTKPDTLAAKLAQHLG
jgi:protein SCO1/2